MTIKIEGTPNATDALPTVLFDNLFTKGPISGGGGPFPPINATTEDTVTFWGPTGLPTNMVVDLGTPAPANACAIVGHNCGTRGNTLLVQTSVNNSTWVTVASLTPTDNSTILLLFPTVSSRYWRLNVTGGVAPIISVVLLGQRFNFPAGIRPPYKPVWLSQTYEMLTSTTLGGQFVGNKIQEIGGETQINLVSFERKFAEETLLPFRQHYNLGKAFVFASGPSVFTKDVGYVWRKENSIMAPVFDQNGSWLSASMDVYCYGK